MGQEILFTRGCQSLIEAKFIQDTIEKQFNFYLKTAVGVLPKAKVTEKQAQQLKERKDNLTPIDLQELERITNDVNQAHHIKKIKKTSLRCIQS